MALNQDGVNFLLCPKQGMYFGNFLRLTGPGFQILRGSPLPKHCSSTPSPPPPRDGVEVRSAQNSIALHLVVRAVVGCAYYLSMLPLKYTANQLSGTRLRDLLVSLRDTYIRAIFTTLLIFKICFILKSDQSF